MKTANGYAMRRFLELTIAALVVLGAGGEASAASCVWKVTDGKGAVMFLGGSVHQLRATDYPLPPGYNFAFDACARLAFETDPDKLGSSDDTFLRLGKYGSGDSLKNHVDPRTYDYLRRFFKLLNIPEEKFSRYRAWFLVEVLESFDFGEMSFNLGVEQFLQRRAIANHKPVDGLTPIREHLGVLAGLTDKQGEILLLEFFIPDASGRQRFEKIMTAWHRGDAETIARESRASWSRFPSYENRLIQNRNLGWMPKLEKFLHSGQAYFVVVGSAHLGGSGGLLELLRARGYKLEQI